MLYFYLGHHCLQNYLFSSHQHKNVKVNHLCILPNQIINSLLISIFTKTKIFHSVGGLSRSNMFIAANAIDYTGYQGMINMWLSLSIMFISPSVIDHNG